MSSSKTRKLAIGGAVVALLVLIAVPIAARPCGHGPGDGDHHGMLGRMLHRLDLSEEQRTQLHALFESQKEETAPLREQMRAAHAVLAERVHADELDEAAIREAAAALAPIEAELAVARARGFQQLRQILTEEQLAQLKEMHERARPSMGDDPRGFGPHGRGSGHSRGF
jgi:Spy/CpxP family protein refolding chaperone